MLKGVVLTYSTLLYFHVSFSIENLGFEDYFLEAQWQMISIDLQWGSLSVIGEFADSFGFLEDPHPHPPDFKVIKVWNFEFLRRNHKSKLA